MVRDAGDQISCPCLTLYVSICSPYLEFNLTTTMTRLTGQDLITYVDNNQSLSRIELCQGAGYYPSFTDFYVAILDARKANGEYQEPQQSGADWYDSLTDQDRELYDMIEDRCPEFTKLDAEQCQEFMDELSDLGITTAEQFQDAYYYQTDSWNAERDFAQWYAEEIACLDVTNDAGMGSFLVIDWQATWDCNLKYDFSTIEFDGETYFFHNNF